MRKDQCLWMSERIVKARTFPSTQGGVLEFFKHTRENVNELNSISEKNEREKFHMSSTQFSSRRSQFIMFDVCLSRELV